MHTLRAVLGPLIASLLALGSFLVLAESPQLDPYLAAPGLHFWLVSGISLLALVLSLLVSLVGARAGDARVAYLGAGFMGLAGFFMLHGLATPGFIINFPGVTQIAAQLSVASIAIWMVTAAYSPASKDASNIVRTLLLWSGLLVLCITAVLVRPEVTRLMPVDEGLFRWAFTLPLMALLAAAGARFLESYRLSRSGLHLVMLYVVGWLAVTQLIMVMGEVFRLSWWLYHGILLLAVLAMLITVARQMHAGTLEPHLRALLSDDAEWRVRYGLRPEVRALVVASEARDRYTAGHMQRVATYAVKLGRALGLGPEELRSLAQAGVIHDVGKIEIPDAVLNKPGPLASEEYAQVKAHPEVGARIGRELGLQVSELVIIRHHHEQWDGSGYPDGLRGVAIPRLARVLAVADVYDALTSERAYRPAWAHEQALRHLEDEAGRAFDPAMAKTWVTLMRKESPGGAETGEEPARQGLPGGRSLARGTE